MPKLCLSSSLSLKCEVLRPSELAKSRFISQYVQPLACRRPREVPRVSRNFHLSSDLHEFSPVVNDLHRNVCEIPRKTGLRRQRCTSSWSFRQTRSPIRSRI